MVECVEGATEMMSGVLVVRVQGGHPQYLSSMCVHSAQSSQCDCLSSLHLTGGNWTGLEMERGRGKLQRAGALIGG